MIPVPVALCAGIACGLIAPVAARADAAAEVRAALASGQPALIEFGAETCKQCKRMKVVLDGVSQRYSGRAHVVPGT